MRKRILMLIVLGGALALGCGDDDSAGTTGDNGSTGGGAGSAGSSDGTGGGDGTSGGEATCADYCAYVADLGCEADVEQDCVDGCNEARATCPAETEALFTCFLEQPLSDYQCDAFDEVSLDSDACDDQSDAFFDCIL